MKIKKWFLMEKKYKLVDGKSVYINRKMGVYLIVALKSFSNVRKGEIGGYIESEKNLSQKGDCWVYDNAIVCGEAIVCDNAQVSGNAIVCDRAVVCDNAIVKDNARILDYAVIQDNARIFGNAIVKNDSWIGKNKIVKDNDIVSVKIIRR